MTPTPVWATAKLLSDCVKAAARSVEIDTTRPDGSALRLAWGEQVDTKSIRPANASQVEDESGEISEARLASYVVKYAPKAPVRKPRRTGRSAHSWTSTSCTSPTTTGGWCRPHGTTAAWPTSRN